MIQNEAMINCNVTVDLIKVIHLYSNVNTEDENV